MKFFKVYLEFVDLYYGFMWLFYFLLFMIKFKKMYSFISISFKYRCDDVNNRLFYNLYVVVLELKRKIGIVCKLMVFILNLN